MRVPAARTGCAVQGVPAALNSPVTTSNSAAFERLVYGLLDLRPRRRPQPADPPGRRRRRRESGF